MMEVPNPLRFSNIRLLLWVIALLLCSSTAWSIKYTTLCGHLYSAVENCDALGCSGKMVVKNICQYSFFKIPIPPGATYVKVAFRNRFVYHRFSCRFVKVLVRMDNDYLGDPEAKHRRVVFLDELLNGDLYLLEDDVKAFVSFRKPISGSHYLYIGTLSHVDEMVVSVEFPSGSAGRLACYGVDDMLVDGGCSPDKECESGQKVEDDSSYAYIREFFWRFMKTKCMPGNLSQCGDEYDCEDAGGYWVNGTCLDAVPLAGEKQVKCGYLCISSSKKAYVLGEKVDVLATIPKFASEKVDVYFAVLFPDGSLKLVVDREELPKLMDVEEASEVTPFKSGVLTPANLELSLPTMVHAFNGDPLVLMPPGAYMFYMAVAPEDSGLSGSYLLTQWEFEVKGE